MPYVYRRPFDYAQRTRRDVLPHTQSVELSKPAIAFAGQSFTLDFTGGNGSNTYRPRSLGVYRKTWNFAERINRNVPPRFLGAEFTTATITFVGRPFSITATSASAQGAYSATHRPRVGVFRKQWNYAERNARPEITWIEQAPSTTLELTKATIAFSARAFTIDASKNFNLTKATITFAPRAFTLLYAPIIPFTTATIAFQALPFSLGGASTVTTLSHTRIDFTSNAFTVSFDVLPEEYREVVPYLIGSTELPALVAITAIRCIANVIGTGGSVVSQDPEPFSTVLRGATITITLGGAVNNLPGGGRNGLPPYNSSVQ